MDAPGQVPLPEDLYGKDGLAEAPCSNSPSAILLAVATLTLPPSGQSGQQERIIWTFPSMANHALPGLESKSLCTPASGTAVRRGYNNDN